MRSAFVKAAVTSSLDLRLGTDSWPRQIDLIFHVPISGEQMMRIDVGIQPVVIRQRIRQQIPVPQ